MLHDRGEEWRQSIRQEGAIDDRKESIITNLKVRFGNLPSYIIDLINNENDLNRLKELFESSILTDSIDSFYNIISNKAHT